MILLIGSTGYIGSEFIRQLKEKNINYKTLSYKDINKDKLLKFIQNYNITHIINCAAFVGVPNIEACESQKDKCIKGNILLPLLLKEIAEYTNIIFCHISTGCLYNGKSPSIKGWNEKDNSNFNFNLNNCGFYTGTKVIAEDIIKDYENTYIWRIRLPFENIHNQRNYISKILNYNILITEQNSLSNKTEFVSACLESIFRKIPYGIYNITNTGSISATEVIDKIKKTINPNKIANFLSMDQFYKKVSAMPRANCITDNSKLLSTGIKMSNVHDSIDWCLKNWRWE